MSRRSVAWSAEIWRESEIVAESTRLLEDESRRFCFNAVRDCVGSEKMSFGIGKRPNSNGSRLG